MNGPHTWHNAKHTRHGATAMISSAFDWEPLLFESSLLGLQSSLTHVSRRDVKEPLP